jgi:phosphate/sulfate permease
MEIFENKAPEKKNNEALEKQNDVYRACLNIVLEVFAVLIGVGIHHFFTKGQDDWGLIAGYTGWIFWSAFIALLCSALSYFIGGGLYLHATYLAHPKKPHEYLFLLAIASRVFFGVLLLWAAKSPDFAQFLCRLLFFEGVGFGWSILHLVIAKHSDQSQKKSAKLAMLWFWTDLVAALFLFALLHGLNSFGPGVLLAVLLIVGSVLLFAYDFIMMVRISLEE